MYCGQCGMENRATDHFCARCGAELPALVGAAVGSDGGTAQKATASRPEIATPPGVDTSNSAEQAADGAPRNEGSPPFRPFVEEPYPAYGGKQVVWPERKLVGFGPRFIAWLVDIVLLGAVNGILTAIHLWGLGALVDLAYFTYFWTTTGQTVGMLAMNIKVVRADGRPLTVMTAVLRYAGYILSFIALGLGFLWVLWDPHKQGWHDKIAGTVVVYIR